MKALVLGLALTALAAPAFAELKPGAKAPDFTAPAFQAGKETTFSLADARKKGPVVLFFFPAAETAGCNLEAKMFADASEDFKAQGASVIGVTAGNVDKLQAFSADSAKCSGKFPVAADPGAKIAASYDATLAVKPGWSSRTSYVIAPDGRVVLAYSNLKPDEHVTQTLAAVKAWKAKK
jgi:thioredoxin-dependent peroxiredoxin